MDTIDTSTIGERLELLAARPEYDAIRGELMHAAAELHANHELLRIMITVEGWRNAMGYVNAGVCHGCGQDIFLPPLGDSDPLPLRDSDLPWDEFL